MTTTGWRGFGNSVLVTVLAVELAIAHVGVVTAAVLAIDIVWPAAGTWAVWAVVAAMAKAYAGIIWACWVTKAWGLDLVRRRP